MLRLFNTSTQKKELFTPLKAGQVHLYVCGITPYDTTHLGHAFTYISFDLLVRFLQFSKFTVTYSQNVTDINDRDNDILQRAKEQNIPWNTLSDYWTQQFLTDMDTLHWIRPTYYLKASEHIPAVIDLISLIIKNGYGYEVAGSVYMDISKKKDYGKLSRFSSEQMLEKAKIFSEDITNPDKRHPLDITLWRSTEKNQPIHIPTFQSPWGNGRPGWHIECSAMSIETLGKQLDIHGGGIDLLYPHHESEVAQSEAATEKIPFARWWMHTGVMKIKGEKMSKSLGNLILVKDLLKKYSPNAIRFVLLSHRYNDTWEYKDADFKLADETISRLQSIVTKQTPVKQSSTGYFHQIISYLEDDLQTPQVLERTLLASNELEKTGNQTLKEEIIRVLTLLGFSLR